MMKTTLLAGALAFAPFAASAVTLVEEGAGPFDVTADTLFTGVVKSLAEGPGIFSINFFAPGGSTDATADVAVTFESVMTIFSDLTMSWVDGVTQNTIVQSPGIDTLTTVFVAPNLLQQLQFSWSGSTLGAGFGFDVVTAVSQVPLPAPLLLLLSAIAGLAFLSRGRRPA